MNPFSQKAALPAGTRGERGFATIEDTRANAKNQGVRSYALIECKGEFAWIAPPEAFAARALPAIQAGIKLVELAR